MTRYHIQQAGDTPAYISDDDGQIRIWRRTRTSGTPGNSHEPVGQPYSSLPAAVEDARRMFPDAKIVKVT